MTAPLRAVPLSPEETAMAMEGIEAMLWLTEKLMREIPPIHDRVLRARFFHDRTLQDVAEENGFGRERIRQIQEGGVRKVRCLLWAPEHRERREALRGLLDAMAEG